MNTVDRVTDSPIGEVWFVKTPSGKGFLAFSEQEAEKMKHMDESKLEAYMYFKKLHGAGAIEDKDVGELEQRFEPEASLNVEQLISLADYLDANGATEEAQKIDALLQKAAEEEHKTDDAAGDGEEWKVRRPGDVSDGPGEFAFKTPQHDELRFAVQAAEVMLGKFEALDTVLHHLTKYMPKHMATDLNEFKDRLEAVMASLTDFKMQYQRASRQDELSKTAADEHDPGEHDTGETDREEELIRSGLVGNLERATRLVRHAAAVGVQMGFQSESYQAIESLKKLSDWLENQIRLEYQNSLSDDGVTAVTKDIFGKLAQIADQLDKMGSGDEADLIDKFIAKHAEDADSVVDWKPEADTEQSKRYDSEYHHSLQIREPKTKKERVDREGYNDKSSVETYQPVKEASIEKEAASTRHCPEHIGVQMGRVGVDTYQCPIDGKTYNWEVGWTDYDGQHHQGGSVAAQTPDSTGYAIPSRIFDSRENVINRVN